MILARLTGETTQLVELRRGLKFECDQARLKQLVIMFGLQKTEDARLMGHHQAIVDPQGRLGGVESFLKLTRPP